MLIICPVLIIARKAIIRHHGFLEVFIRGAAQWRSRADFPQYGIGSKHMTTKKDALRSDGTREGAVDRAAERLTQLQAERQRSSQAPSEADATDEASEVGRESIFEFLEFQAERFSSLQDLYASLSDEERRQLSEDLDEEE